MRPKLNKRNFAICHLRFKQNLRLKEIAEMFNTTESNVCHILERHHKAYTEALDKNNPLAILELNTRPGSPPKGDKK